jgi:hypothetical protein
MSRERSDYIPVPATLLQSYVNGIPEPQKYYNPHTQETTGIYDLQRPPHGPVYLPYANETVAPPDYDYAAPLFQNADYNSIMLERSFFDLLDYLRNQLGSYYQGMMDIPLNPQERQRYY